MNPQEHSELPELLTIGFLCHDLHEGRHILGGTASYSSIMASHLGMKTALLTSVGADFKFDQIFEDYGISICNVPARATTVFENIYKENTRIQYIHNRASTLFPKDLPPQWKQAAVVKFCLIADEADYSFLPMFPNALVGATIQGWLRQWDENGRVSPKEMDWELLRYVDIVFMSEEDIQDFDSAIPKIIELVNILVMTKGKDGAVIFYKGEQLAFPAFPTTEVDPTGAGDIFAASFLFKFHRSKNIIHSIAFAHAAASYIVEDFGIKIPPVEAIQVRYEAYLKQFCETGKV